MELKMTNLLMLLSLLGFVASGCTDPAEPPGDIGNEPDLPTDSIQLAVQVVASGLSNPLYLTAPAGDPRLFIVEQPGRIRIVASGQLRDTPFLDIDDRVQSGGERGLLGMAFHPDYATNGFLYVSYTDSTGDSRIERYAVTGDPNVADPGSGKLILAVDQPFSNHNGGQISFGPDGMLYIGLGDGGSGGDPQGHGQNRATLLGALLRIDVDGGDPYATPPDNPFVGDPDARGEIWGYGLRNPWRFAFDVEGGDVYIADVGQSSWEEVHVLAADSGGANYGWNVMEGMHCYRANSCDMSGLVMPVVEYDHGDGCSVTGGFVYRGSAIPELRGHYFYSDYCSGFLRSFRFASGTAADQQEWDVGSLGSVLSFGQGADGELYILSGNGRVYRLTRGG